MTNEVDFCPECQDYKKTRSVEILETRQVLDQNIECMSTYLECTDCGERFFDDEIESSNLFSAYDAYKRANHLVTSSELKSLREVYELSQKDFSNFLGWGDVTIHRYEKGAIQDKAHNTTLKLLIMKPENALLLLQEGRGYLPTRVSRKLKIRLQGLVEAKKLSSVEPAGFKFPVECLDKTTCFSFPRWDAAMI